MKVKEVEELIKIVGKGNLLEALFIFLSAFHNPILEGSIDRRGKKQEELYKLVKKEANDQLDYHFNLKHSLEGMFIIYAIASAALNRDNELSVQEVMNEIYRTMHGNGQIRIIGTPFSEVEHNILEQEQLTDDQKELEFINVLVNSKGERAFKKKEDFEKEVLASVRELLKKGNGICNTPDGKFALIRYAIDCHYSIHQNIKINKDIVLLFCINGVYKKLSPSNQVLIKEEELKIIENTIASEYIGRLCSLLQNIGLSDEGGLIKYGINDHNVDQLEEIFSYQSNQAKCSLFPKNIKKTLEQLLKNQNSDEFEKRVTDPKNIHYSALQQENRHSDKKKKEEKHTKYKNTACKLILGVFVVSALLCAVDYFLMKQKLLQPVKNILPQDNLTNLIIATVLTIIIVSALFQLLKPQQEPPKQKMTGVCVAEKKLENIANEGKV